MLEVAGEVRARAEAYRQRLKLLVENAHVMRPDELHSPLRTMRELMEIEGELVQLHQATGKIDLTVFDDLEHELRGLRDSIGRIVATSIVQGIYENGYLPENYGVVVSERLDGMGFNLEIPYDMISMSDLFMLRSKKIAKLDSLFTVRQVGNFDYKGYSKIEIG